MRSFERKLDRALDHLGALEAATQRFFEREPCGVIMECDMQTREFVVCFRVWEDPSDEVSVLASDCVHDLRQALDHIAYRLAISISGRNPPPNEGGIYFPITGSSQQFEGKLAASFGSPKRIPADIRTVLQGVQPYNGGHWELLAILDDLDNIAKHRFPPLMMLGANVPSARIGELTVASIVGPRTGPVEADTEIMRFLPKPDSAVDVEFRTTKYIAFAKGTPGEGLPIHRTLATLRGNIRSGIVEPLDAYL